MACTLYFPDQINTSLLVWHQGDVEKDFILIIDVQILFVNLYRTFSEHPGFSMRKEREKSSLGGKVVLEIEYRIC